MMVVVSALDFPCRRCLENDATTSVGGVPVCTQCELPQMEDHIKILEQYHASIPVAEFVDEF